MAGGWAFSSDISAGNAPPGFITSGFAVKNVSVSASYPLVLFLAIILPVVVVGGFVADSCVGDGCVVSCVVASGGVASGGVASSTVV